MYSGNFLVYAGKLKRLFCPLSQSVPLISSEIEKYIRKEKKMLAFKYSLSEDIIVQLDLAGQYNLKPTVEFDIFDGQLYLHLRGTPLKQPYLESRILIESFSVHSDELEVLIDEKISNTVADLFLRFMPEAKDHILDAIPFLFSQAEVIFEGIAVPSDCIVIKQVDLRLNPSGDYPVLRIIGTPLCQDTFLVQSTDDLDEILTDSYMTRKKDLKLLNQFIKN